MKRIKKLLAVLLAVVMVASMGSMSVMAGNGGTYTITITNTKSGHVYEAYQIFSGTLDSTETTLSDIQWGSGIKGDTFLAALKASETEVGTSVTVGSLFANCSTAAQVAEVLANNNGTYSTLSTIFAQIASENLSSTVAGTSTESASPYTITELTAGYYLVKDKDSTVTAAGDAYTDIILKVVKNVSVEAKAVYPTVTKTADKDDAGIGDTVSFTITGSVPDTSTYDSYTYIFNDTLSKGFTYDTDSLKVSVDNSELSSGTDYELEVGTYSATDGTTIKVTMSDAKSLSGKTITVTYTATLNSNVVSGSDGNTNKVTVTYSNNPNGSGTGTTTESKTTTFTFNLDITKVDGDDITTTLEGVTFVLKNSDGKYYKKTDNGDGTFSVSWVDSADEATVLKTDSYGAITVSGLDVGTYTLTEKETVDGYNKLTSDITIVIAAEYSDSDSDGKYDTVTSLTVNVDSTGATESTDADKSSVDVTVKNYKGSVIPSTGGIGTTIFYVVGAILVVGAAVILVTRRRMASR